LRQNGGLRSMNYGRNKEEEINEVKVEVKNEKGKDPRSFCLR